MRGFVSCILASLLITSAAVAQTAPVQSHKQDKSDKWEVYAGYAFDRSFGDTNFYHESAATSFNMYSPYNQNGGQASVAYFPWKHVGVKAAFTYSNNVAGVDADSRTQEVNISRSYLVGPVVRWTVPGYFNNRISVFGQQLFGAAHTSINLDSRTFYCNGNGEGCRASGFATVTGGGFDVRINRYISVRPGELDYWNRQINMNHFYASSTGDNNYSVAANGLRYSTGLSVHF